MGLARRAATDVVKQESENNKEFDTIEWGNLEAGDHEGRLVMVADLGLQDKTYKGEFLGNFQQISLCIEAVGQGVQGEESTIPRILWMKPMYIYEEMNEKSNEFKYYSMFNPDVKDGDVPDWEALLGKPISFTVAHVKGKGDKASQTYDNITDIAKIPAKYQDDVEVALHDVGIGDSDDPENMVTKSLFGLTKWVYDRRIGAVEVKEEVKEVKGEESTPDNEDNPF